MNEQCLNRLESLFLLAKRYIDRAYKNRVLSVGYFSSDKEGFEEIDYTKSPVVMGIIMEDFMIQIEKSKIVVVVQLATIFAPKKRL